MHHYANFKIYYNISLTLLALKWLETLYVITFSVKFFFEALLYYFYERASLPINHGIKSLTRQGMSNSCLFSKCMFMLYSTKKCQIDFIYLNNQYLILIP